MDSNKNCQEEIRTVFDCVPPKGGAIAAAAIADIIADGLNSNQIAAIGGFITIVGDSMGYIAAQMDLNDQIISRQKEKAAGSPAFISPPPK